LYSSEYSLDPLELRRREPDNPAGERLRIGPDADPITLSPELAVGGGPDN